MNNKAKIEKPVSWRRDRLGPSKLEKITKFITKNTRNIDKKEKIRILKAISKWIKQEIELIDVVFRPFAEK